MELKALEILKNLHSDIIDGIESGVNSEEEKAEVFECIEELEELENRSCENCKKGFNCPIFKKLWKDKLRKEGYLISLKEFDCRFWESK